jgi:hypothetical protein
MVYRPDTKHGEQAGHHVKQKVPLAESASFAESEVVQKDRGATVIQNRESHHRVYESGIFPQGIGKQQIKENQLD